MTPEPRRLLRDIAIYGLGPASVPLIAIVTIPVLTRVLSPSDYGVIEVLTAVFSAAVLVATLGLDGASQREYFEVPAGPARRRLLGTALLTATLASLALASLGLGLAGPLTRWLFDPGVDPTVTRMLFAAVPAAVIAAFALEFLRLGHRPGAYASLSVLSGLISATLLIVLVRVLGDGLRGYYAGVLLAAATSALAGLALCRGAFALALDRRRLSRMLGYGLPIMASGASALALQFADRMLLLWLAPRREVGLYGIGFRLASIEMLAVTALSLAWLPFVLELHASDPAEARRVRERGMATVTLVLCSLAVALSVPARELLALATGPPFHAAYVVVGPLCGAFALLGLNALTTTAMIVTRSTRYLARYGLYALVASLGLNIALIAAFGMVGAAFAVLLGYVALSGLCLWRAQRLDPVSLPVRHVAVPAGAAAAVIVAGTLLHPASTAVSVALKLGLIAAFAAVAWSAGGVHPEDRRLARAFLRRGKHA